MKTKIALYLFDNKKSFVRYWHCDSLVCMQSPNLSQWCHFMQATKLLMYIWQNRIKCLFYVHVWFIDTFVIQLEWTAIFNVATLIGPFCWESPEYPIKFQRVLVSIFNFTKPILSGIYMIVCIMCAFYCYASALGAGGIMFLGCPSIRPSEAWNTLIWPVHGSVGPSDQPWPFYGMSFHPSVCLSVRPERFLGICGRTHGGNSLKFYMLMYLDHLQKWLLYGHSL